MNGYKFITMKLPSSNRRAHRVGQVLAVLAVAVVAAVPAPAQPPASETLPTPNLSELLQDSLGRMLNPPTAIPPGSEPLPGPGQHVIPIRRDAPPESIQVENIDGLVRLVVRDAPIRQVLGLLAESQKINLVFSSLSDVSVTVALDNVPLSVALDAILTSSGHTWSRHGDVIYITQVVEGLSVAPSAQGRRLQVFELDYAAAADVDLAVKGLLSPVGKSWIIESSRTDNRRTREIITVEDLPEYVDRVAGYIAQADQAPRQVLVEVQILQVDLESGRKHGVDFQEIGRLGGTSITFGASSFADLTTDEQQIFSIDAAGGDLTALVQLLESTSDAKTLASPKLLAVNGQESEIQVGKQLPYRETTNSPSNVSQESVKFLDVGVILRFTPWITRDGRVLMHVAPEVSDGAINSNQLPETVKTEVSTDVFLSDGQGVVIGGLIQEKDVVEQSKIPVLGDIPYLGTLFQRRQTERTRSEIIVAIMPHLLPYNCVMQDSNDFEVGRARDPLLHGPLCRHPRPYEARLPDITGDLCSKWEEQIGGNCQPYPGDVQLPSCSESLSIHDLFDVPESVATTDPASPPGATSAAQPRIAAPAGALPRRR